VVFASALTWLNGSALSYSPLSKRIRLRILFLRTQVLTGACDMPKGSSTRPQIDIRLVSSRLSFQLQAHNIRMNWKWVLIILLGIMLKWIPELTEYIRVAITLLHS